MLCQLALNHFCPLRYLDFQNEHICHYTLVVIIRGKKEHTHLEREESYHHAFQAGCLPIYIPFGPTYPRKYVGLHELAMLFRQQVKKLQNKPNNSS
jgi:hypothetical protein